MDREKIKGQKPRPITYLNYADKDFQSNIMVELTIHQYLMFHKAVQCSLNFTGNAQPRSQRIGDEFEEIHPKLFIF